MRDQDTNAYDVPESSHEAHKKRIGELVDMYLASLHNGTPFKNSFLHFFLPRVFDYLAKRATGLGPAAHRPNNTCVPGKTQLFVSSQGKFYMCNNVCGPGLQIGNCDDGIDIKKVQNLLRAYVSFCDEMCQNCWAYRLCSQCFTQILEKGHISKQRKLENCRREREEISLALKQYVRIWENEPASTWGDGDTLHAIVSQCHSSPACDQCPSVSKKARVTELIGEPLVSSEEIRSALRGRARGAPCVR
jgi:radical SAM protein with 4Fe4S-binding SPASM domain